MCIRVLLVVVLGIIFETIVHIPIVFYAAAVAVSLTAAGWFKRSLFIAIGLLSALNASLRLPLTILDPGRDNAFSGTVISEDHQENGIRLTVVLNQAFLKHDTIALRLPVEIYTRTFDTYLGRQIVVQGIIIHARSRLGPNGFRGKIVTVDSDPRDPVGTIFHGVRQYIDRLFKSRLRPAYYQLASSLVLGGSSRVGDEMAAVFTRAGVLHILSVSGLHVGFLITFLGFFMAVIPLSMRIKYLVIVAGLFLYAGITGFIPTVLRAGLMAVLFALAVLLERNVEPLHMVNISALMLLVGSPGILLDVGAQLSYASIYGIIYWYPRFKDLVLDRIINPWLRKVGSLMSISIAAQIFVTPFLIHYFRQIQTMATISNLIVVPLSSLITYLLFALVIIGLFSSTFTHGVGVITALLLHALVAVCRFFARWPWATIGISLPPVILFLSFFLFSRKCRKPAVWCLVASALVLSLSAMPACAVLRIDPDSILITTADGQNLLVTRETNPAIMRFIAADKIDYLIGVEKCVEPRRDFIAFPGELKYKRIEFKDITVCLSDDISVMYRNRPLHLDQMGIKKDETAYIIVRGDYRYGFRTRSRGSIVDDIITECRLIAGRLMAWFG